MDTAIKQRILGGLVLVTGAAIFLPLMLDGSGAKLLSRLDPVPSKPPVTAPVKSELPQPAETAAAGQAVAEAHEGDVPFYPVGPANPPAPDAPNAQTTAANPPVPVPPPPAAIAKTPEQLAAEEAARQRAAQLLASPGGISPEEAAQQQKAAEKLKREMTSAAKNGAVAGSRESLTDDGARARAILEARNENDQQQVEDRLHPEKAKPTPTLKADKPVAEKAAVTPDVSLVKLDDKTRDVAKTVAQHDKPHSDKPTVEKAAAHPEDAAAHAKAAKPADKADKNDAAAHKAALARQEQLKAEAALEGKSRSDKAEKSDKSDKTAHVAEKTDKADKAEKAAAKSEKADKAEKIAKDEKAKDSKSEKTAAKDEKTKDEKKDDKNAKAGGWIVQVASVSSRDKADALSAKLKGKGYRAHVVQNGETWKVVIGPEIQKESATGLRNKLNGESGLGVSGAWVAPWKP